jgi:hypothetical protein
MGIFFGVFSGVIWAGVPIIVKKNIIGTAMGFEIGLLNLGKIIYNFFCNYYLIGLTITPIFVGLVLHYHKEKTGYFWVVYFFIGLVTLYLVILITNYFVDNKKYGRRFDSVITMKSISAANSLNSNYDIIDTPRYTEDILNKFK